jgi:hypothetical protein
VRNIIIRAQNQRSIKTTKKASARNRMRFGGSHDLLNDQTERSMIVYMEMSITLT